jgi:prepilin-type processing-associated H-X9-DG protein
VSKSNYIGVSGYNDPVRLNANGQRGVFHRGRHYAFRDITDGQSNTFMVGERNKFCAQGAWAGNRNPAGGGPQGCDYTLGRTSMPINLDNNASHWCTEGFASEHAGGAQFLMGDGSVQFVSENIDFRNHIAATDLLRDGNGPNRTGWNKNTQNPTLGTYQRLGNRDDGQTIRGFVN